MIFTSGINDEYEQNMYGSNSKNKYKNSKYLTQCTLKREIGSSSMITIGWVPADKDPKVLIKGDNNAIYILPIRALECI